jgi:hypothetical protein
MVSRVQEEIQRSIGDVRSEDRRGRVEVGISEESPCKSQKTDGSGRVQGQGQGQEKIGDWR